MKITIKRVILLVQLFLIVAVSAAAEQPVFPIKVSENRRYFIAAGFPNQGK
jgi:hypothetical protein